MTQAPLAGLNHKLAEREALYPDLGRAMRSTVAFMVPLILGYAGVLPRPMLFAAIAAQNVAMIEVRGDYRVRLGLLLGKAIILAAAAWLGHVAGDNLMFAVLAHDFGKPATTKKAEKRGVLRWTSAGHEAAGGPLAKNFLRRIGAPLELDAPVGSLVVHHLAHHHGQAEFSDTSVRRLARKLAPATIDGNRTARAPVGVASPSVTPRR